MKKTLQSIVLIFFSYIPLFSQNGYESILQEYLLDNSAFFLEDNSYHFSLFRKQQWNKFLINNTFVFQKSLSDNRVNLGVIVDRNNFLNAQQNTQFSVPISYKIRLPKGKLSFGLEPGLENERLDVSSLYSSQPGDPSIETQPKTNITLGTGLYYRNSKMDIGLSINNLINKKATTELTQYSFLFNRLFQLTNHLGYRTTLWTGLTTENSLLVKLRNQIEFKHTYYAAFLIDKNKNISVSVGTDLKQLVSRLSQDLRVFYSYSHRFNELSVLGATHEIGLSYYWNRLPSKEKVQQKAIRNSPLSFD